MIIPFDVSAPIETLHEPHAEADTAPDLTDAARPDSQARPRPISSLTSHRQATVDGRVHSVEIRQVEHSSVLACTIANTRGEITALFYGRSHIPGLRPGSYVRLRGTASASKTGTVLINPAYELLG
jgi:RecG-like helicase